MPEPSLEDILKKIRETKKHLEELEEALKLFAKATECKPPPK